MQETRHNADNLRFIYGGPTGLLEFRMIAGRTGVTPVLIWHTDGCDAEHCTDDCDCEFTDGQEIAIARELSSNEQTIWSELARRALAADLADVPQPPVEPSADQRALIARARTVGEQMAREGYFSNPDTERVDLTTIPDNLIDSIKAGIEHSWADGVSLEDAILSAAEAMYRQVLDRGGDKARAERLAFVVVEVGAQMQAAINPNNLI